MRRIVVGCLIGMLGGLAPSYGSFGPTMIRILPVGIVSSLPPPTVLTGESTVAKSAITSICSGDFGSTLIGPFVTTETPQADPPACCVRGSSWYTSRSSGGPDCGVRGAGSFWSVFHPTDAKEIKISKAKLDPSAALWSYRTSKNCDGISLIAALSLSKSRRLGNRICCNSSLACAVSFRAMSPCVINSAICSALAFDSETKSFWATSATRYSTYADTAESIKPPTPTTAPINSSRTPHKSQNSIGEPQSIDWSLALFAAVVLTSAAPLLTTILFLFKAGRIRRR
jgi:hypothetical protein